MNGSSLPQAACLEIATFFHGNSLQCQWKPIYATCVPLDDCSLAIEIFFDIKRTLFLHFCVPHKGPGPSCVNRSSILYLLLQLLPAYLSIRISIHVNRTSLLHFMFLVLAWLSVEIIESV